MQETPRRAPALSPGSPQDVGRGPPGRPGVRPRPVGPASAGRGRGGSPCDGRGAVPRDRRRQHLPRRHAGRGRRRALHRGLHGHARHGHQRAGRAERDRAAARHPDPGAVGHPDGGGVRALHPPPRRPASREGPGRHLRRRHRQSLLHDRHGGGAQGVGDGLRRDVQGHPGRRRLLGRSQEGPGRQAL